MDFFTLLGYFTSQPSTSQPIQLNEYQIRHQNPNGMCLSDKTKDV